MTRFSWDFAGFLLAGALVSAPACAVIHSVVVTSAEVRAYQPESTRVLDSGPPKSSEARAVPPSGRDFRLHTEGKPSKRAGLTPEKDPGSERWSSNHERDGVASAQGALYEVTAYSHGCILPVSGQEGHARRAANGRWPIADLTVAADTSLHPFGSELLIEGLGFRTVGDRGHAIKGRRLDLFVDSCREARRFGRRWLSVTVVPAGVTRLAAK